MKINPRLARLLAVLLACLTISTYTIAPASAHTTSDYARTLPPGPRYPRKPVVRPPAGCVRYVRLYADMQAGDCIKIVRTKVTYYLKLDSFTFDEATGAVTMQVTAKTLDSEVAYGVGLTMGMMDQYVSAILDISSQVPNQTLAVFFFRVGMVRIDMRYA